MKKSCLNLFLTLLMLVFFESKISANEVDYSSIENQEECYIFLNNLENIELHQNNLLLEMQGGYYSVRSLQKIGNQWLVAYNGYCPRMHPLCECGQCHNPHCHYYIKDCPRKK